jgi:hypothetical protein
MVGDVAVMSPALVAHTTQVNQKRTTQVFCSSRVALMGVCTCGASEMCCSITMTALLQRRSLCTPFGLLRGAAAAMAAQAAAGVAERLTGTWIQHLKSTACLWTLLLARRTRVRCAAAMKTECVCLVLSCA